MNRVQNSKPQYQSVMGLSEDAELAIAGSVGQQKVRRELGPCNLMIPLLIGVNAEIRKTCNELAEQGFVARPIYSGVRSLALTLTTRARLTGSTGLRLYQAYDRDAGVRDIKATLDAVAKLPECTGKIAVQGDCLVRL